MSHEHKQDAVTIGTCSECDGPVIVTLNHPAKYQCDQCGAVATKKVVGNYGVIVDMGPKDEA